MDVPFPPSPVKCEGKTHFLYELHITNFGVSDVTLQGVEGLPYVLESFEIMRKPDGADAGELYMKLASWKSESNPEPDKRRMETHLNFYVIRFSDE